MATTYSLSFILLLISFLSIITDGHLIQMLEDEIGAENFTYYRLQRSGVMKLEVTSVLGDVDIYISTEYQHPSYYSYDLKSETCGVDTITIPASMPRPVYIALFGHPNYLVSRSQLRIYELPEQKVMEDYESLVAKYERYYYDDPDRKMSGDESSNRDESYRQASKDSFKSDHHAVDDGSPWWKLVLGIIEFIIDNL